MFSELKSFEIIDFHTHPFDRDINNICQNKAFLDMGIDKTLITLDSLNIKYFCGSVIRARKVLSSRDMLFNMIEKNDIALNLKELYQGRYIPGFHIHPLFVNESCKEIDRMNNLGVKLIGELVPYIDKWDSFKSKGLYEILEYAEKFEMVVSFHSSGYDYAEVEHIVKSFPKLKFVGAHPDEGDALLYHIDRLKRYDNYYLDISGNGLYREGMLRRVINQAGINKILFGSDFPACNVAMFVGGVLLDNKLSDSEKEMIFYKNAKELLKLK